jgi:RpiR family carbohydrate utilization transcriptional regulator
VPDAELLRRIAALREALAPAEARVADAVLRAPAWVLQSPLSAVAARARVSDPTVIRFCRSLGLDGYQSFRLRLAHSLGSGVAAPPGEIDRRDSPLDLAAKIFGRAARALREASGQLPPERLEAAMRLLAGARRIECYGLGGSALVAAEARRRLLALGLPAACCAAPGLQRAAASVLGPGDVVVAVSASGRAGELVANVELAREAGAAVIGIAPPGSALAARASVALEVSVDEQTDGHAPMTIGLAQLVLVDVLSVGVALRLGPELVARRERARARREAQPDDD